MIYTNSLLSLFIPKLNKNISIGSTLKFLPSINNIKYVVTDIDHEFIYVTYGVGETTHIRKKELLELDSNLAEIL